MTFIQLALLAAVPVALAQSGSNSPPDWIPPGTPWPYTTYANATDPYTDGGAQWGQSSPPSYPSPWGEGLDDWAAAYAKARAFVSQLTLTEKVNLTTGVSWEGDKCVGNTGSIPRLGFRSLCLEDSPLGVRDTDFNSAFGAGVMVAATWDRQRTYNRGFDMGSEHVGKGVDAQLGPVVGPIGRSPEGGRNWEGFSPDPVLSGILVAETIKGMQDAGVMATTKHYIVYEQEHFRQGSPPSYLEQNAISSNVDDITMHELYLWPFADAVRAGTAAIMCSYNQINNSFACQNSHTLNYLLKNELGFQGFVMSDWSGQHSGVSSALAGLDMTMPGDIGFDSSTSYWGTNLTIAVLNGTVPQWRLDDMCVRIVAAWYYVDREGHQVPDAPNFSAWTTDTYGYYHYYAQEDYEQINYHVNVQDDHYKGIRDLAAAGTILLKNTNGALPLTGNEKLTAVFGEDAGENVWGPNGCSDRSCDNGTLAMGWGSGTANFPYLITPLEAIKAEVRSHNGDIESVTDNYAYSQATALARRVGMVNGACIAFGNADSGEGYLVIDNNEGDRNNLTIWNGFDTFLQNITSECNNTIVVIHSVGPVLLDGFYDNPNVTAILWAGIPGQESGNSITDILYGKVNPGGKLPFTLGAARGEYGTDILYLPNNGDLAPQDDFSEGVFIDYRAFDKLGETPLYEFGFGLSYTTFEFSNLQITQHSAPAYTTPTGQTPAAPTYGSVSNNSADYLFPSDINRVQAYIYPYLNSTSLSASSGDPNYGINYTFPAGGYDSSPQPLLPAGGAPGGNPRLYDVLFTVTATITNTGSVEGDEVGQLYISLGGKNDPKVVLRNFDRITIQPGQSATFSADITRRDVSNWNTNTQNWYISSCPKTVYVGNSSRNLPLKSSLDVSSFVTGACNSGLPNGGNSNGTVPVPPYSSYVSSATGSASASSAASSSAASGSSMSSSGSMSGSASSMTSSAASPTGYSSSASNSAASPTSYSSSASSSAASPTSYSSMTSMTSVVSTTMSPAGYTTSAPSSSSSMSWAWPSAPGGYHSSWGNGGWGSSA